MLGMDQNIADIRVCIENLLQEGHRDIAIFPFGDVGMRVKQILNESYGIREAMLCDNHLCRYTNEIQSIDSLAKREKNLYVILASTNPEIYLDLKSSLLKYIDKSHIAELDSMKPLSIEKEWRHEKTVYDGIADADGNRIKGHIPNLENTTIKFCGKNNILYCEEGVRLRDSQISFWGDNGLIYLSKNRDEPLHMEMECCDNSVIRIGKNNSVAGIRLPIHFHARSGGHIFTGDDCMFSNSIVLWSGDGHLIYDVTSQERTDHAESIYIGDHVWIGHDVSLLHGTRIDSGSIIGSNSVLSHKIVHHNECWAGNPARRIRKSVFWTRESDVGSQSKIQQVQTFEGYRKNCNPQCPPDYWCYEYHADETISFDTIEEGLRVGKSNEDKLAFLITINEKIAKNRFVHFPNED